MKLSIKTSSIELTYEDEYSNLLEDVKKRLIEIIHAIPISNSPIGVIDGSKIPGLGNTFTQAHGTDFPKNMHPKYVGTVENFFNQTKDK